MYPRFAHDRCLLDRPHFVRESTIGPERARHDVQICRESAFVTIVAGLLLFLDLRTLGEGARLGKFFDRSMEPRALAPFGPSASTAPIPGASRGERDS